MKNWFDKKIEKLTSIGGYKKPDLIPDSMKLDSNENYVIPKQFQNDILSMARKNSDVREYPLGRINELIKMISKFSKVPASMIGVGNGSDQILDLILSHFASKNTKILTSNPTFGFFEERCKLYSIKQVKIPFSKNMDLRIEDFIKKAKSVDMIYLDSPNNPTGFQFSNKDLEKLIKSFSGPIIIDEAYGEFSNSSILSLVKKYPNIILVKTLSKAFGLAGLRIGYMIADKKFTEVFSNVIQYPYPLNTLAIECGILAIEKSKQIISIFEIIKKQRARIIQNLKKYDAFDVFDSNANFVLFDAKGADTRVYNALIEQGISIRKLGKLASHKGCLRVTIGTPDMNSKFLLAIRDLLE